MSGCLYAATCLLQITYTSDEKDLDFSYVYFLPISFLKHAWVVLSVRVSFSAPAGRCLQWKSSKKLGAEQQAATVNIVEHLAAEGLNLSIRSWCTPKKRDKREWIKNLQSSFFHCVKSFNMWGRLERYFLSCLLQEVYAVSMCYTIQTAITLAV